MNSHEIEKRSTCEWHYCNHHMNSATHIRDGPSKMPGSGSRQRSAPLHTKPSSPRSTTLFICINAIELLPNNVLRTLHGISAKRASRGVICLLPVCLMIGHADATLEACTHKEFTFLSKFQ